MQANEVFKMVLGLGDVLSGKLLTFDALTLRQFVFDIDKDENIEITGLHGDYEAFCGIAKPSSELTFEAYISKSSSYNLLDVRTAQEKKGKAHSRFYPYSYERACRTLGRVTY